VVYGDTMTLKENICEGCGAPASVAIRDILRRDNLKTGYVDFEADGPPHFFCESHQRASVIRDGIPIYPDEEVTP